MLTYNTSAVTQFASFGGGSRLDDQLKQIEARADRVLRGGDVATTLFRIRALIGPMSYLIEEGLAQQAFDQLRNGDPPSPEALEALETVIRLMRPAVACQDNAIQDLPTYDTEGLPPPEMRERWHDFRADAGDAALPAIGRIDRKGRAYGTGFLVAPSVLMTCRHVVEQLTGGTGVIGAGSVVNFRQEKDRNDMESDKAPIRKVLARHPRLDMAMLELERPRGAFLDLTAKSLSPGEAVVAIGYPGPGEADNPAFLNVIFQSRYGVKRASYGETLDGTDEQDVFHDCTTTRGSSGSPIFHLQTGNVVAMHRSGSFLYRNEAVPAAALITFLESRP